MAERAGSRKASDPAAGSVDPREVAKFAALGARWWDPEGPQAPLHQMNPTRLRFIRDQLARHFSRDALAPRPLDGLRALDVGCGGGLASEPLARLGAAVTGIDAAVENVEAATAHAATMGLAIDYRAATAETLAAQGERFDIVLTLEVVEHVNDPQAFLTTCATLVAPGGALVLATLNRTPKSFLLGVLAAEYVLRWLPVGTHEWRRFLRPSEAARGLRSGGLAVEGAAGVVFDPLTGTWSLSEDDLAVNYMLVATRPT